MNCPHCDETDHGLAEIDWSCGCTHDGCDTTEHRAFAASEQCRDCAAAEEKAEFRRNNRPGSALRSGAER